MPAKKLALTGKDLRAIGFPESPAISVAIQVAEKAYKRMDKAEALAILQKVAEAPADFLEDKILAKVARALMPKKAAGSGEEIPLEAAEKPYAIFGAEGIEQGAIDQMRVAAKLPIAVAGALMPDAHHGYGLPIGGVLATENAVIPYGVGVDIGCRMCISIFDIPPADLEKQASLFKRELNAHTVFGAGGQLAVSADREVLTRPEFDETHLLRALKDKAWRQLGTSGSGNHFVEFGIVEITERDAALGMEPGTYVGLLSHSGSRALGANVAAHYTKLAKDKRRLPQEAQNLAWLSMDEEEGIEYWRAMNLAGDYASACHHVIHDRMAAALGRQPIGRVENHHNFAWKETHEGREVIVHRKGATPAGKGVLGVIPGSMAAPGFIVRGRGEHSSIASASHGAGRKMSRTAAIKTLSPEEVQQYLAQHGVTLLGGGLDEAPMAYKDIHAVMAGQRDLVDVLGSFMPKIVRMDGTPPRAKKGAGRGGKISEGE